MDASIRREDGWLALAGLFWLHPGENTFGSSDTNDIVLPDASPPHVGTFLLDGGVIRLQAPLAGGLQIDGRPAQEAALQPDSTGDPTRVSLGSLHMIVIQRGERTGIRLWDNNRRSRTAYPGRIWFPANPSWQLEADFEPHDPPLALPIPNVLGDTSVEPAVGRVTFNKLGQVFHLEALTTGDGGLWLIFRDRTNGEATYPSGRFLVCPPPEQHRVALDFNRAYNPPCAFTDFATCPLPPPQNSLDLRIEAGERYQPLLDSPAGTVGHSALPPTDIPSNRTGSSDHESQMSE